MAAAEAIGLLVTTSIQALAFLDFIAARTDALASSQCEPKDLERFAHFTFRDLVCQPDARRVLQKLMQGGVIDCRPLHAKCPQLFSAADLEVQEAFELLNTARSGFSNAGGGSATLDVVRLSFLVQRALRTLDRHAAKVDLTEVTSRLREAGALKGLIEICTHVARARDPHDEVLRPHDATSARIQELHYKRVECYQVVLEVFEELLARAQSHESLVGPTAALAMRGPRAAGDAVRVNLGAIPPEQLGELPELLPMPIQGSNAFRVLDMLLHLCLEGHSYSADELFHYCILKWMMQRDLPAYRFDSPYLKGFLETQARDKPVLLCRYFQHRGRWAEACDAYMALARHRSIDGVPELSPDERMVHLQSAVLCARMPGSNRRVEPALQAIEELVRRRSSG